jgi:hypothetical protein
LINVRRLDEFLAVTTEVTLGEVIAKDENNIGRSGCVSRRKAREHAQYKQAGKDKISLRDHDKNQTMLHRFRRVLNADK